ncbi:MAG: hypothetical protein MUF38_11355 [Anaerolineae bacterium]|jgi:hypothetical protein|nr:hypothetical protein [Anaerolineae bacterium]
MRNKTSILMLLTTVFALLGLTTVSIAQDPTPEPIDPTVNAYTITDIINSPENYYGSVVNFDGIVSELVNVKAFVVDDEAFLGTNQVLVINNTGSELPVWISRDVRVRVTGVVYPRTSDGGLDQLLANVNMNVQQPMVEATAEDVTDMTPTAPSESEMEAVDPMPNPFGQGVVHSLSSAIVPERLVEWTIIELTSIEDVLIIQDNN